MQRNLWRSFVIVVMTIVGKIGALAAPAVASAFAPSVFGLSPSAGPTAGGTVVHVFGTGLDGTTAVHFGSAAGTGIFNVSPSEVDVTSPAGAGVVDITVTTAAGTSTVGSGDLFTYTNLPVVHSLSPGTGPTAGGTVVNLTGANFTGTTAVKFGATAATSFTVLSATSLHATAPAAAAGTVH